MKKRYILVLVFLILSTGCGKKQSRTSFGKVTAIKGAVEVYNSLKAKWNVLDQLTEVFFGDSIRTMGDAELEILFEDDNSIKLAESTTVYLQQASDSSGTKMITVSNATGKVLSELKSLKEKKVGYVVQTPTARAEPKGTHFLVTVVPVTYVTHVTVFHGDVYVYHSVEPVEPVVVFPGYYTVVSFGVVPLVPVPMNYGQFKKMHRVLGPRVYGHYSARFKIKPHKMKHSAFIVPHRGPGKFHMKGPGPGPFKAKLRPGKGAVIKRKGKPGKVKLGKARPLKANQKKVFKAKPKGIKGKGKMKRK